MELRYERKYLIPPDKKPQVKALIHIHPAGFHEIFHLRHVNSLYFDDARNTNWIESEEGFFHRKKIRIRWYGDLQGTITAPRLEIKQKQGILGGKHIFPLASFTLSGVLRVQDIREVLLRSDLPGEIRNLMRLYTPSLINRYHRSYHLSADAKYRITLDDGITYFGITGNTTPILHGHEDPSPTVLELKYDHKDDPDADALSENWPFRLSRKSKYASGMNLTRFTPR